MVLSRDYIQKLFLKDAERSKRKKEEAAQERLTAKWSGGRLLETAAGAGVGFLTGGPLGAVTGGISAATGKGDVLESAVGGGVSGMTLPGVPPALGQGGEDLLSTAGRQFGELTKAENISKMLPTLKAVGAPKKAIDALQTFSEMQERAVSKKEKGTYAEKQATDKHERAVELAKVKADQKATDKKAAEEAKKVKADKKAAEAQAEEQAEKEAAETYNKLESQIAGISKEALQKESRGGITDSDYIRTLKGQRHGISTNQKLTLSQKDKLKARIDKKIKDFSKQQSKNKQLAEKEFSKRLKDIKSTKKREAFKATKKDFVNDYISGLEAPDVSIDTGEGAPSKLESLFASTEKKLGRKLIEEEKEVLRQRAGF